MTDRILTFNVPNIIADINSFSEMILHLTSLYNLPEILEYSFCKALLADKITVSMYQNDL